MAEKRQPEAIQKGVQELEKEITCPVCHGHFQEPKILPCCHYYCKGCVLAVASRAGANQPFACPECRCDTVLPQNDPNQLPTAFFLNRMIELHAKMEKAYGKVEALCDLCRTGTKAAAFCRQCAAFICDKCAEAHHRMKTFDGHIVVTLDELKEGRANLSIKRAPPPSCKSHDEPQKVYCYSCSHLICRDCVLDDHAGHKYDFVKKSAPVIKQKLAEHLIPLKGVQKKLHDANKVVKLTKFDIKSQDASASVMIEQSFQEFHDIIEQCKLELLKKLSIVMTGKLDRLNAQEKGFDMTSSLIQSLIDFVKRNIENLTEEELMDTHTQLLNRISEETKKYQLNSENLEPVEEADVVVELECVERLRKYCQNNFKVVTVPVDISALEEEKIKLGAVNETTHIKVQARVLPNGKTSLKRQIVKANLVSEFDGSVVQAKVEETQENTHLIKYTPRVRGRHQLKVTINSRPIEGSPFPVLISIHPTELGKPIKVYHELKGYCVAINSNDDLVFAEQSGDIVLLDRGGNQLRRIKKSQHGFKAVIGLAVDSNDNIYATDIGTKSIYKFKKDGTEINAITPRVKNFDPRGIAVSNDQVVVADKGNYRLMTFTCDLESKKIIDFYNRVPTGVACDKDGKIYICDFSGGRIKVLNAEGEFYTSFGNKNNESCKLSLPHSICVDKEFVYITEWGSVHCVSVFTKKGKFVTSFGQRGNEEGEFISPCGLATDSNGVLYVCDLDNCRIQAF